MISILSAFFLIFNPPKSPGDLYGALELAGLVSEMGPEWSMNRAHFSALSFDCPLEREIDSRFTGTLACLTVQEWENAHGV